MKEATTTTTTASPELTSPHPFGQINALVFISQKRTSAYYALVAPSCVSALFSLAAAAGAIAITLTVKRKDSSRLPNGVSASRAEYSHHGDYPINSFSFFEKNPKILSKKPSLACLDCNSRKRRGLDWGGKRKKAQKMKVKMRFLSVLS